jgi:hypothetical protein
MDHAFLTARLLLIYISEKLGMDLIEHRESRAREN